LVCRLDATRHPTPMSRLEEAHKEYDSLIKSIDEHVWSKHAQAAVDMDAMAYVDPSLLDESGVPDLVKVLWDGLWNDMMDLYAPMFGFISEEKMSRFKTLFSEINQVDA
jgi:hypothetical protein